MLSHYLSDKSYSVSQNMCPLNIFLETCAANSFKFIFLKDNNCLLKMPKFYSTVIDKSGSSHRMSDPVYNAVRKGRSYYSFLFNSHEQFQTHTNRLNCRMNSTYPSPASTIISSSPIFFTYITTVSFHLFI